MPSWLVGAAITVGGCRLFASGSTRSATTPRSQAPTGQVSDAYGTQLTGTSAGRHVHRSVNARHSAPSRGKGRSGALSSVGGEGRARLPSDATVGLRLICGETLVNRARSSWPPPRLRVGTGS